MNPCSGTTPQKRPDPGLCCRPKPPGCGFRGRRARRDNAMTNPGWTYRWTQIAAAGLLGLAVAATASSGARAQNQKEDDEDTSFDTKIMRNFLQGLGLRRDGGGIEYRERSPLVVPPARNLPEPEK